MKQAWIKHVSINGKIPIWKHIVCGLIILLLGIILSIYLWIFVFATFIIPTPSMNPFIMCGDRIVVNKLIQAHMS